MEHNLIPALVVDPSSLNLAPVRSLKVTGASVRRIVCS